MYDVLIERTAERDLKSLTSSVFDRILPRIKALADNPRPTDATNWLGPRTIGGYGSATIESSMKLMTPANR